MTTLRNFVPTAARLFLGLVFTVFGLNYFFPFIPQPPMPAAAAAFAGALLGSGYLFPLMKGIEIAAGVALLSGRFVPLALTLLAPIIVNIVGFHGFVLRAGLPLPLVILAAELYLAYRHRDAFAPMLRARNPVAVASAPRQARPSLAA
jgi:uncharacterized membrane protein YphA (DoxX/SURF4 family)